MIIAVVLGSLASFWATLSELYRLGGAITGAGGGIGPSVGHIGQFGWLAGLFAFPARSGHTRNQFYGRRYGFHILPDGYADAFHLVAPPSSRLPNLHDGWRWLFLELPRYQQFP